MAPTPPARIPCLPEAKESGIEGEDAKTTATQGVLDVVTEFSTQAARNATIHYYDFKEDVNMSGNAQERIPRAFYDEKANAVANYINPNATWSNFSVSGVMDDHERLLNVDGNESFPTPMSRWHEFQIIKAVVLAAVTVVILISVCKMIFQLFVRYTVKHDK